MKVKKSEKISKPHKVFRRLTPEKQAPHFTGRRNCEKGPFPDGN